MVAIPISMTGVSEDALPLKNMLDGILERIQTVFQSYNVSLPGRQYWTIGQPVIDCEQLVVSFIQMYLGAPGDEATTPQRCHMPRSAVVSISVVRSAPIVGQNGRPPSAHQIQAGSGQTAVDAWVLMESIRQFDMWDDTGYGLGVIATVDVSPPEGGFQSVNMQLTLGVP